MKQVINKRGTILVEDVPEPVCGPGEVKIALTHSLISTGTELRNVETAGQSLATRAKDRPDLVKKVVDRAKQQGVMAAYRAVKDKLYEPKALGYSATGVVLEVGEAVTRFAAGDRVACGGASAHHAAVVCVPENLVAPVPDELDAAHGAFATVGSIAMQGIRRAQPEFGELFVVMGLGLIGQLCVQFAKVAGCRVLGFDTVQERVDMAKELGADAAYLLSDGDPIERVAAFTDGVGADAVIVAAATKSNEPINTATLMCRERGKISIVGVVGMEFDRGAMYMKELDVYMARSYGPGRYDTNYEGRGLDYPISYVRWTENRNMAEVLRLVAEGRVQLAPLIQKTVPIDEAPEAYGALQSDDGPKPLAVLLAYPEYEPGATREIPKSASVSRKPVSKVRVALVGCGNFAKLERLPYLTKMTQFELAMLVSHTGAKVKQLASEYGVKKYSADYREALADPDIDLLVVATPHSTHGEISLAAAEAGKDLLVEKPMAISAEELERVYAQCREAGIRYACGFNRRYAPAAVKLREMRARNDEPCTVIYRANVGLIPPNTPMHAPEEGGGRIVGEACHFYDFCNWLVGARPVSVASQQISYDGARFAGTDNLSSVIKYADGSAAVVVYSTIGNTGLPKERVEFFMGGAAAVLEDFTSLKTFGGGSDWSGGQDKGHRGFMEAIGTSLCSGEDMPIGLDESYLGNLLTFKAMEAARTGSGVSVG